MVLRWRFCEASSFALPPSSSLPGAERFWPEWEEVWDDEAGEVEEWVVGMRAGVLVWELGDVPVVVKLEKRSDHHD